MKGGVGKTTTVISLAETLAAQSIDDAARRKGKTSSILVIDLDAQASASFALAGDTKLLALIRDGRTIDGFLERFLIKGEELALNELVENSVSDLTHHGKPLGIGLLASSPRLRIVERNLLLSLTRGGYSLDKVEHDFFKLLSGQLRTLCAHFDMVIFDCPPGISVLTEIALRMADLTIVPVIPDFLSVLGLDAFTQHVWPRLLKGPNGLPPPKRPPHVLINMLKPFPVHDKNAAALRKRASAKTAEFKVFDTVIPATDGVPEALDRMTPATEYDQKWNSALRQALAALAREVNGVPPPLP